MVLSLSRTAALLQYYGAPAKIYHALPMPSSRANGNAWPAWLAEEFAAGGDDATVDVCVGDEWYRFPSSYHFPSNKYRLRFLKAGFDGALPMPFDFSKGGTAHTPEGLNDDNRAHPNQYVDPSSCRFLVEAEFERGNAHSASKDFVPGEWIDVAVEKFIDPSRSPTLTARLLHPRILGEEERVRRLQTQTPRARADVPDGRVRRRLHHHPDRS